MGWINRSDIIPANPEHKCEFPFQDALIQGDVWKCDDCGRVYCVVTSPRWYPVKWLTGKSAQEKYEQEVKEWQQKEAEISYLPIEIRNRIYFFFKRMGNAS